ncbi:hypothetical protein [Kouleothrix sp.]|uniref:hypothetical protein n=1 Tax=Kouleothrix sp. TaxID=2779161 RepID=UPI00391B5714
MNFFIQPELIHAAIEDLASEAERALALYQATPARQRTPDERAAIAALQRDLKAYARVADYWAAGVYPRAIDGIWEVASLSERGTQHHIWREHNRWVCDCKAAARGYFHVHQAMMQVIERAMDRASDYAADAQPATTTAPETDAQAAFDTYAPVPDLDPEPFWCDDLPEPITAAARQQLVRRITAARAQRVAA